MCGITGIMMASSSGSNDSLEDSVKSMNSQLRHRGPDDAGVWIDQHAGVALGHTRLSIIDLTQEGHQPMHSPCGRYVIVFNGEIYNFQDLRKILVPEGHLFRGHSDTEVLLAAIAAWGIEYTLENCNGMFAFALWDKEQNKLTLARDRVGKKPLYYGWLGSKLLFGSELKALRAHPDWQGQIDPGASALFIRHNYIPAPYSIYSGIRKLLSGSYVQFSSTDCPGCFPDPIRYWSIVDVAMTGVNERESQGENAIIDHLDELLHAAVQDRLIADVPLGAFLSGGIDSSLIVAYMQKCSAEPVQTFCVGFDDVRFNEAEHAKCVAGHLGTVHTELYVSEKEALEVIPKLPQIYDEPFSDLSQIPTFLVSQMARQSVTVALSGDGGDELFAGYPRHFETAGLFHMMGKTPYFLQKVAGDLLVRQKDRLSRLTGRPSGRFERLGEVLAACSMLKHRHLVSSVQHPQAYVGSLHEPMTPLTDPEINQLGLDFTEKMMLLDQLTFMQEDILAKVDRSTMAVGLEARTPLLDYRIIEFAWKIPLSMKIRGKVGKSILRRLLCRHLPRNLIERPKKGFSVPIDRWLRGELRGWVEDTIYSHSTESEGVVDINRVRRLWENSSQNSTEVGQLMWNLLIYLSFLKTHS